MRNEIENKPKCRNSDQTTFSTVDEFERRFFPLWYEKQKLKLNPSEGDSFGESLARFSAERHLKYRAC
jgi:hypothetical protein